MEIKDFARLAVGILMLGLAIYLSLNFEEEGPISESPDSDQQIHESVDEMDGGIASSSGQVGSDSPDWQAPTTSDHQIADNQPEIDFVRPVFDESPLPNARPLPRNRIESEFSQPPRISDQYHPSRPLMVVGRFSNESDLVPVQPRPSFTGTISYARQLHTIRHGDTLQSISHEYLGNVSRYLDIYALNKDVLANPAQLPVGVEIRIPSR